MLKAEVLCRKRKVKGEEMPEISWLNRFEVSKSKNNHVIRAVKKHEREEKEFCLLNFTICRKRAWETQQIPLYWLFRLHETIIKVCRRSCFLWRVTLNEKCLGFLACFVPFKNTSSRRFRVQPQYVHTLLTSLRDRLLLPLLSLLFLAFFFFFTFGVSFSEISSSSSSAKRGDVQCLKIRQRSENVTEQTACVSAETRMSGWKENTRGSTRLFAQVCDSAFVCLDSCWRRTNITPSRLDWEDLAFKDSLLRAWPNTRRIDWCGSFLIFTIGVLFWGSGTTFFLLELHD